MWHQAADGILTWGIMEHAIACPTRFEFYYPYNLKTSPSILMVCRNPHSHSNPTCSKTPDSIVKIFNSLLLQLDWCLADATPRRLLLDSAFMNGPQNALHWSSSHELTLSDLHPSFGNLDHTARLINKLWFMLYPHGMGFPGTFNCIMHITYVTNQ